MREAVRAERPRRRSLQPPVAPPQSEQVPPPNPLNAITPIQTPEAAERTTRHMRTCAELADLAMQLARVAAARALADWSEPEQSPPTAEPQSIQAEPQLIQWEPLVAQPAEPQLPQLPQPPATPRYPAGHRTPQSPKPIDPAPRATPPP